MPRQVAPQPDGQSFQIKLEKPFSGPSTHSVEVIGEFNRSSNVSIKTGDNEKTGDVKSDDVNELLSMVEQVLGFPSHPSKDIYGLDTKLSFHTSNAQWASDEGDNAADELGDETKQTMKDIVDSIEALGRQFAKNDAAI